MILTISSNTLGFISLGSFAGGFLIALISSFIPSYDRTYSRISTILGVLGFLLITVGFFMMPVACGVCDQEKIDEEIASRKYQDRIEVYSGKEKINEYSGEIIDFRTLRDCYLIRMMAPDKTVMEIREPKTHTIIKDDKYPFL